jgi:hypothetical protein
MVLVDLRMDPNKPRLAEISRQVEVELGITLITKGLGISSYSHFRVVAFSNDNGYAVYDGLVGTVVCPADDCNLDKLSLSKGGHSLWTMSYMSLFVMIKAFLLQFQKCHPA